MMCVMFIISNAKRTLTASQDFLIDSAVDIPLIRRETPMSYLRAEYESQSAPPTFLEKIDWLISNGCDYVRWTKGT
jgi:hypothetical protein